MFGSKNKKHVYPCKPQFYYIKVGCKGVFVTRTCFRDVSAVLKVWILSFVVFYGKRNRIPTLYHNTAKAARTHRRSDAGSIPILLAAQFS